MNKAQYWKLITVTCTFKQYERITRNAGLKYDNYFNNTLKYTKSKQLHAWALEGLDALAILETNRLESVSLSLVYSAPQTLLERELTKPIANLRVVS